MHRVSSYFKIIFFVLPLIWPLSSRGEGQSLGEVTVHAEEEQTSGRESSHDSVSFSEVITTKELKGKKTNLPEVLQESSGVSIRNLGGLDDFATVSIRGSTTEQVTIYLDGLPLNTGTGGAINLATIPTDQIERIEVYKGAAPASFGSSSIGGVINIITKKGRAGRETKLTQSYGSFETSETTLLHSEGREPFSYQAGYTYQRSAGDFSFVDDNGTPFNRSDDQVENRRNNEFARHNFLTKLEWSHPQRGVFLHLQNQFFREDRGIPGLANLTSDNADLSTTRNGSSFEITKKGLLSNFDLTLNPYFQFQKQQFSDPTGEIGLGTQDNNNDTFQYGSRFRGHLLIGRHQRWSLHLEYRGEQFLPEDFARSPSSGPRSIRNSFSAGLEDEFILLEERLIFNPSFRTEHLFNQQGGAVSSTLHPVSGKMGVKYSPWGPKGPILIKTNLSRSYRLPSFSELFGDQGTFAGNEALRPERSINWDIGTTFTMKPIRLEVSYFLNHVDDLIQLLQTSQYTIQAQNLSQARIQGVEVGLSTSVLEHLSLSGNYTFQWAKDTSGLPGLEGKFLPGRPMHEISGQATLSNRWGKVFASLTFLDNNFLDSQNILQVNDRLLINSGFSVSFLKRFTTSFEAKNLVNDRVTDVVGFPLPGRSYYGKLEIQI